jgi:chemotaxis protein methyltransferase CheR
LLGALPHDLLTTYFSPDGMQLHVTERLRRRAHWQQANILEFSGDGHPWDLILCRNVALYLEPASQERLWGRIIAREIADSGALVVGKGERPSGLVKCFSCVYQPPMYRQKDYNDE